MGYKKRQKKGRKKGTRNLIRTADGFLNQNNVLFTPEEKKALENAVRTANRRSKKMHEVFDALPYKIEGRETGATVGDMRLMGKEADFSIAKKSSSLQRFKSKEEYSRYMQNLNRVNSPDYIVQRARQYKQNYRTAILNYYSYDEASDILMKIRMMKPEDYIKNVATNEELEIQFVYGAEDRAAKLNAIRSALGLKHREIEPFWDGDDY